MTTSRQDRISRNHKEISWITLCIRGGCTEKPYQPKQISTLSLKKNVHPLCSRRGLEPLNTQTQLTWLHTNCLQQASGRMRGRQVRISEHTHGQGNLANPSPRSLNHVRQDLSAVSRLAVTLLLILQFLNFFQPPRHVWVVGAVTLLKCIEDHSRLHCTSVTPMTVHLAYRLAVFTVATSCHVQLQVLHYLLVSRMPCHRVTPPVIIQLPSSPWRYTWR